MLEDKEFLHLYRYTAVAQDEYLLLAFSRLDYIEAMQEYGLAVKVFEKQGEIDLEGLCEFLDRR